MPGEGGGVLAGIRVLEVATYGFVPSAGAALADLGADVIKIEHPVHGDPMRHIPAFGMAPGTGGLTLQFEAFNRGKRSVVLDLKDPAGYEHLMCLVETADVFITNFLPAARQRARIDVDHIRARNPDIIYARGSGHGARGAEADAGGFDVLSFWYRTGVGDAVAAPGQPAPPLPSPAFGDVLSGLSLAGGITAALLGRERTGRPTVVDLSLMSVGMWAMQIGLIASDQVDHETMRGPKRQIPGNPLVRQYLTCAPWVLGFPDLPLIRGVYQVPAALPFVPGAEVCGEMVALGDAHSGGERIGMSDVVDAPDRLGRGEPIRRVVVTEI